MANFGAINTNNQIDLTADVTGILPAINLPVANDTDAGIISVGYQNLPGAKTFRNDTNGGAKGMGLYNADTTDNNGLTINWETNTTGAGAQAAFATTFLSSNVTDHNHATVTATAGWSVYNNGVQRTFWSIDDSLQLYTDASSLSISGNITSQTGNIAASAGFFQGGTTLNVLTGQGFNQGMHNIGGAINVPATGPVTGTNIFGTNLAQLVTWSEDMDGGVIPFIGASVVGYVGQLAGLVTGKTMEVINMAVAGMSDAGSVAGAALNNWNGFSSGGIVGGSPLTVTNMRGFYVPSLFGGLATNEWGISVESTAADNYFEKSVTIGNNGTGVLKTTNAGIALEIKDPKALKLGVLTTAERDALTPVDGMIIFNDTTDTINWYDGTSWTAPGGGGGTSIGGTVTGGTAGSVLFIDPAATLAQDNSNLFWDNTNNRLGIGTASPGSNLTITATTDPSFRLVTGAHDVVHQLETSTQTYYISGSSSVGTEINTTSGSKNVLTLARASVRAGLNVDSNIPESNLTANPGSLAMYNNTQGGVYVKSTGTGNTGWAYINYDKLTTQTGNYTVLNTDSIILVNTGSATITLPTTALAVGKKYTIKKISATAGTITVASSGNIDGAASNTSIIAQYQSLTVVWDGSTYWII